MARRQASRYRHRAYWGVGLVGLGLIGLLYDVDFLAAPFIQLIEKSKSGLAGVVSSLGLSFLEAARAVVFNHVDYLSLIFRILVLFLAMVAVIVGLVLQRSRPEQTMGDDLLTSSELRERETE